MPMPQYQMIAIDPVEAKLLLDVIAFGMLHSKQFENFLSQIYKGGLPMDSVLVVFGEFLYRLAQSFDWGEPPTFVIGLRNDG